MKLNVLPLIVSSFLLSACAAAPAAPENTENITSTSQVIIESESPQSDEVQSDALTSSMSVYTEGPNNNSSVKIQYPVFTGKGSDKLNALIYDRVQSFAAYDTELFAEDAALSLEYQSAITLQNEKMVSIVFWGSSYIDDSAYETTELHPLNIDLATLAEVLLGDLYETNTEFSKVFFDKAFFPTEPVTSYDAAVFSEMLKLQTPEYQTIDPFSMSGNVSCFLKPDGIVLSLPSVHATGSDHFEAQLSYDDIRQFYISQQEYWD